MTPTERKLNSEKRLASLGIVLIDNLPLTESEHDVNLRSAQQIARRILILAYLNCVAYDPDLQQEVMMFLIREKLWDEASANEKTLFNMPKLGDDQVAEIQWRAESIWAMLWAIDKVDSLELPVKEADLQAIFTLLPGFFEDTSDFIRTARIRDRAEILDETDFIFRLQWAIREADNRGEVVPQINASVSYERYVSLTWIIGIGDQWQG